MNVAISKFKKLDKKYDARITGTKILVLARRVLQTSSNIKTLKEKTYT